MFEIYTKSLNVFFEFSPQKEILEFRQFLMQIGWIFGVKIQWDIFSDFQTLCF